MAYGYHNPANFRQRIVLTNRQEIQPRCMRSNTPIGIGPERRCDAYRDLEDGEVRHYFAAPPAERAFEGFTDRLNTDGPQPTDRSMHRKANATSQ